MLKSHVNMLDKKERTNTEKHVSTSLHNGKNYNIININRGNTIVIITQTNVI